MLSSGVGHPEDSILRRHHCENLKYGLGLSSLALEGEETEL